MPPLIDITGQKFGRLTVLRRSDRPWILGGGAPWECRCDCGTLTVVGSKDLRTGHTSSCGCLRVKHSHYTEHSPSPTYSSWQAMWKRCTNPKAAGYHNYGGRGIVVAERWRDFAAFLEDVGERPPGMTLERKDVNKSYEPGNVRWATTKEQGMNRRTTVLDASTVKQIRHLVNTLANPPGQVASAFDLHVGHVRDICKGKRW